MNDSELSARPPVYQPNAPRARRVWLWVLLAMVVGVGGSAAIVGRSIWKGIAEAQAVAEAQRAGVLGIISAWDVEALFKAGSPELQDSPKSAVKGYFADWNAKLGAARRLDVIGCHFNSYATNDASFTLISATYAGIFAHGRANVVVRFKSSPDGWQILSLGLTDMHVAASAPASATLSPAKSGGKP